MTGNAAILSAMAAAALFGVSTPVAKLLVGEVNPWMLAGLLYLGSGLGLTGLLLVRHTTSITVGPADRPWLAAATLFGGVLGPVLLMSGLAALPAVEASLLLNAEGVFTAAIAWVVFRENVDRRVFIGMAAIVAGAAVLSWGGAMPGLGGPALAVLAACLCWAIDNNLTRKVALSDPVQVAAIKGLAAGVTNTVLAMLAGAELPSLPVTAAAGVVGFLGYGLSLALFVLALRGLGAARTGAYFSLAPFLGALVAIPLLGDPLTGRLVAAGALMALGVWLHLTERHEHAHAHERLVHVHTHRHDDHHAHRHAPGDPPGEPHAHRHRHPPQHHSHPHYPDSHHRHDHPPAGEGG